MLSTSVLQTIRNHQLLIVGNTEKLSFVGWKEERKVFRMKRKESKNHTVRLNSFQHLLCVM